MKKRNGGFSYSVSKQQVREWMKVPVDQKLQWLEDANEFLRKAMDPKAREIMEKFRKGEL